MRVSIVVLPRQTNETSDAVGNMVSTAREYLVSKQLTLHIQRTLKGSYYHILCCNKLTKIFEQTNAQLERSSYRIHA